MKLVTTEAVMTALCQHCDSHIEMCDDCGMREIIERVPSAWISVKDRLPEERGFYLVSVGAPYKTVRVYEYKPCEGYENENLWKDDGGSYCFNWFVEAWMPLPDAPEVEE